MVLQNRKFPSSHRDRINGSITPTASLFVNKTEIGMSIFRPGLPSLILIGLAALPFLTSPAGAAKCGGNNQRACKVWQRVPSCNKGLTELRRPGYCTRAPKVQRITCGALNRKPCPVTVRIPSCDRGLKEDFVRNRCVRKTSAGSAVELGKTCFGQLKRLTGSLIPAAECLVTRGVPAKLKPMFAQRRTSDIVGTLLQGACAAQIRKTAGDLRRNGLASMSLGISGDIGLGIGAASEFFVALDTSLKGRAYLYETLGFRVGKVVGGSVNGVVTAHLAPARSLAGDGQSFSVSLKALGGAGGSVGFSYSRGDRKPGCTGISAAAGVGAEVNAGAVGRSTTIRLK